METVDEKQIIRQRIKMLGLQQPAREKEAEDRAIENKLFATEEFKQARIISIYLSRKHEVGTRGIIERAQSMGKQVVAPFLSPYDKSTIKLDLIIVPAIAFGKNGGRIGSGKGYYDIFLKEKKGKISIIGLAYEFQVLATVPQEPHDVSMDKIITEKQIYG